MTNHTDTIADKAEAKEEGAVFDIGVREGRLTAFNDILGECISPEQVENESSPFISGFVKGYREVIEEGREVQRNAVRDWASKNVPENTFSVRVVASPAGTQGYQWATVTPHGIETTEEEG